MLANIYPSHVSFFGYSFCLVLIHLSVLLGRRVVLVVLEGPGGRALTPPLQHPVAPAGDLVHPHDVHEVQADAGADPGGAAAPGNPVESLRAVDGAHAAVVHGHDGNAHQEEDPRHGHAVDHVGPR